MEVLLQAGRRVRVYVTPGKRLLVSLLLLAAFWFQTSAQIMVYHSDPTLCGHAGSDAECTCVCHDAFESAANTTIYVEQPEMARAPSWDETTRDLLIPHDIFRPPPTNS